MLRAPCPCERVESAFWEAARKGRELNLRRGGAAAGKKGWKITTVDSSGWPSMERRSPALGMEQQTCILWGAEGAGPPPSGIKSPNNHPVCAFPAGTAARGLNLQAIKSPALALALA